MLTRAFTAFPLYLLDRLHQRNALLMYRIYDSCPNVSSACVLPSRPRDYPLTAFTATHSRSSISIIDSEPPLAGFTAGLMSAGLETPLSPGTPCPEETCWPRE